MDNCIIGRLSFIAEDDAEHTIAYLNKIGVAPYKYKEENINYFKLNDLYIIEFKDKPFILKTLEYHDLLSQPSSIESLVDISCITEDGISLYVTGAQLVDGFIFVPMSNINCIHTLKKEQIDREVCYRRQDL